MRLAGVSSGRIGERTFAGMTECAGRVGLRKMVVYVNGRDERKNQESGKA
jgi:hypothetical protein